MDKSWKTGLEIEGGIFQTGKGKVRDLWQGMKGPGPGPWGKVSPVFRNGIGYVCFP